MKILILLVGMCYLTAWAQARGDVMTAEETFRREGQFVNITVKMGSPIKIFVAGKERARIKAKDLKFEVKPSNASEWEELKLNERGNYYSVKNLGESKKLKLLEVRATVKKKSETFSIPVNLKP